MRTPDRISRHPHSGFIAHYGDEALPLKNMSPEERDHVLRVMVDRYNFYDYLKAMAAAHPEEAHV